MGIIGPIFTVLLLVTFLSTIYAEVSLSVDGLAATIKNDNLELNFNPDATISTVKVNGTNIAAVGQRSFYLDWNAGGQGVFSPKSIHILEHSACRVHFYWLQNEIENVFTIELHYVMEDGPQGVYSYAKYTNDKSYNLTCGETRIVYRFDGSTLVQGHSGQREGTIPTSADLNQCKSVQDSTWQFPNGTYYSKYDCAAYIRETNFQGVFGNGYGAFVISPNREYHGGGPLKQDLTVHQECLVANYFMSGHLTGTPGIDAPPGWVHIYGPFMLYFPTGDNGQIMAQVEHQVNVEIGSWPYMFVNDKDYPRPRGGVSGYVSGQTKARVVLWDSVNEEFDKQELGYLYWANTNDTGYYVIDKIRPGNYKMAAYPLAGQGSENVAESTVTITRDAQEHVDFDLPEPDNIIWSLGQADRRASEFAFADEPRNYQWEWKTPTNLTFIIGNSYSKTDWYYSQPKGSHWYIKYQDAQDGKSRTLRIAIAAASQKPHLVVYVNGQKVGDDYFGNDAAIYRSAMQSGEYYSKVYSVSAAQVADGENTVDLQVTVGQIMYDAISLQRV